MEMAKSDKEKEKNILEKDPIKNENNKDKKSWKKDFGYRKKKCNWWKFIL